MEREKEGEVYSDCDECQRYIRSATVSGRQRQRASHQQQTYWADATIANKGGCKEERYLRCIPRKQRKGQKEKIK